MSDSERAEMLENMDRADEEIDRSDELALLGHGHAINGGHVQKDLSVANEDDDTSSEGEEPPQSSPLRVMGEEEISQLNQTVETHETSAECDITEFQATPFEFA